MLLVALSRLVTAYLQNGYVWQHESHGQHGPLSQFFGQAGQNLGHLAVILKKGGWHRCAQHPSGRSGNGA
jgi:hypothetical protein